MRVAGIGTGIAGNAATWALSKRYPVTVYDGAARECRRDDRERQYHLGEHPAQRLY
jgi:predicted NAD/FAD-dependent oxidoreductase